MSFSPVWPWWLLILIGLLTLAGCLWLAFQQSAAPLSTAGSAHEVQARRRVWFRRGGMVLLMTLALLRPGVGSVATASTSDRLDVLVVVDTTSSSVAEDYGNGQTRLSGMKADLQAILERLPSARFSLITFDQQAVLKLPYTTDGAAFATAVDLLTPEITVYSHGSSVTAAAKLVRERLLASQKARPDNARVVYYLGDGEQTANTPPEKFDIPQGLISGGAVLGYGTTTGGRMKTNYGFGSPPGPGYIQDHSPDRYGDAISKIDEKTLKDIAGQLGVGYMHREAGQSADPLVSGVNSAGSSLSESGSRAAFELYWLFGLGLLVLVGWELFDALRQWRSVRPVRVRAATVQPGGGTGRSS
ncbi:vWA domain-containing protein [Psychromicrobium xiongbiense]|uniref:vWA domain-containing protein n=1 Tax=Psychromicrobium xiongbiense TaxID=3051184 RepID=UPI00255281F8|nr:VWA domain-containing protein [Psychromicrobium sp. YIM S02556]